MPLKAFTQLHGYIDFQKLEHYSLIFGLFACINSSMNVPVHTYQVYMRHQSHTSCAYLTVQIRGEYVPICTAASSNNVSMTLVYNNANAVICLEWKKISGLRWDSNPQHFTTPV